MTREQLARIIDHTQVRAFATEVDIAELCDEAAEHGFASVSVNPIWTSFCAKRLAGTDVGVNPTVGFPLGATTARVKLTEARDVARQGATEIDMVINIGALKSGMTAFVEREIKAIVGAVRGIPVKVILETCYLTAEEKRVVCEMSLNAGAAFVKTSTGFGSAGAREEDILFLREVVGDQIGVKAAGGIRSYGDVMRMVNAGATRIGTSTSVTILEDAPAT